MTTNDQTLIYLVEDDVAISDSLTLLLKSMDYAVEAFSTGELALSAFAAGSRPNLLITDLKMPGLSGLELIRQLREDGHRCPCVLLTGSTDSNVDESECLVLRKPVNPDRLLEVISQLTDENT